MYKYDAELRAIMLADNEAALANEVSARMCALAERHGKTLFPADIKQLYSARERLLREADRIELGAGILPQIVYALCDSPFIDAHGFADALEEFMELFYSYKNDCEGEMTDDELIDALTGYFNGCEGDWQQTADASFAEILRAARRE